jgi:hypothetical protein
MTSTQAPARAEIQAMYKTVCATPSDLNQHLKTMKTLAMKCTHVTELNSSGFIESGWSHAHGLLLNNTAEQSCLVLVCPKKSADIDAFSDLCKRAQLDFEFVQQDYLNAPIQDTDMLFIDSWHVYGQMKRELQAWHSHVNKYIVMHDTTVDEWLGETVRCGGGTSTAQIQSQTTGIPTLEILMGIWPAIVEFLSTHADWKLKERFVHNNGLTILERIINSDLLEDKQEQIAIEETKEIKMPGRVAVCYWGMTRSTKKVYQTHFQHIFDILKQHNIEFDVYMHTWFVKEGNRIWNAISAVPIDYEEYKLLNPTEYKRDDQAEFLTTINFADYWNAEAWAKYGDTARGDWWPELLRNHLCALESLRRVTQMCKAANKSYDLVIYARPDIAFKTAIPMNMLGQMTPQTLITSAHDRFGGVNDRFAIVSFESCERYASRNSELKEYHEKHGRITAEGYLSFTVQKYFSDAKFIDFNMEIIRP